MQVYNQPLFSVKRVSSSHKILRFIGIYITISILAHKSISQNINTLVKIFGPKFMFFMTTEVEKLDLRSRKIGPTLCSQQQNQPGYNLVNSTNVRIKIKNLTRLNLVDQQNVGEICMNLIQFFFLVPLVTQIQENSTKVLLDTIFFVE